VSRGWGKRLQTQAFASLSNKKIIPGVYFCLKSGSECRFGKNFLLDENPRRIYPTKKFFPEMISTSQNRHWEKYFVG